MFPATVTYLQGTVPKVVVDPGIRFYFSNASSNRRSVWISHSINFKNNLHFRLVPSRMVGVIFPLRLEKGEKDSTIRCLFIGPPK